MKHLLYWLKREYGREIDLVHITSSTVNVLTGEPDLATEQYNVLRAVMLPIELHRTFVAKMRSTDYNYGDAYDRCDAVFLVEKKDLPIAYNLTFGDYIIYLTRQFKILAINDLHAPRVEAIEFIVEDLPVSERITLPVEVRP